jgi:uncharacterized membrane protein
MRKSLDAISLAASVFIVWITWQALYGPNALPDRIPIHFDLAGHPNGWGTPATLWILCAVPVGLYLFLGVMKTRLLKAAKYPVEVTDENRVRLEALNLDLMAWIKAEMICLFAWIQWSATQAARYPERGFAAAPQLIAPLVVIFATVIWFKVAMRRVAHTGPDS